MTAIWVVPAFVVVCGSIALVFRARALLREAEALSQSLVAVRDLGPELRQVAVARAELAASLQQLRRQ